MQPTQAKTTKPQQHGRAGQAQVKAQKQDYDTPNSYNQPKNNQGSKREIVGQKQTRAY